MPKILVVDDEKDQELIILQRFSRQDFLQGYQFLFARNGMQGLELVRTNPDIELILLDINMPEMDGLRMLEQIPGVSAFIKTVIISAYGDMGNIRTAMNRGAYDFLTKPISLADLGLTIRKTLEEVHRLKENARIAREHLDLKQKATDLEMQVLRTQMNPHFIFNSLNSINRYILQNNREQASAYLTKFSRLVRLILQHSKEPLISLDSELESLKLYLELESLRFEHRFSYRIELPEGLNAPGIQIPPLLIQPFAENAIWHGLMPKDGVGEMVISLSTSGGFLHVAVTDDGVGRKMKHVKQISITKEHQSMGMQITADRIRGMNGSLQMEEPVRVTDLVHADGSAAGTTVLITLPLLID